MGLRIHRQGAGTLAKSKSALYAEIAARLHDILGVVKVAVISGGDWPQFEKQLLLHFPHDERLMNLCLLLAYAHASGPY
jgi:phosphomannomutase